MNQRNQILLQRVPAPCNAPCTDSIATWSWQDTAMPPHEPECPTTVLPHIPLALWNVVHSTIIRHFPHDIMNLTRFQKNIHWQVPKLDDTVWQCWNITDSTVVRATVNVNSKPPFLAPHSPETLSCYQTMIKYLHQRRNLLLWIQVNWGVHW